MPKKKILWVVYNFVQAGGQRYVYEICKALNKEKYEVDVLKAAPMNSERDWDNEFYYQPTLDIGCKIILLANLLKTPGFSTNKKNKKKPSHLIGKKLSALLQKKSDTPGDQPMEGLSDFFNQYDVVNFSGISVYGNICIKNKLHPGNAFIHVLTFSFQGENMYHNYDKTLQYKFVSPVTPAVMKSDLNGFKNYTYTYFPLCFDTHPYKVESQKNNKKQIALFTRLSPMKPLDPFFYAFKILTEQGLDAELTIYGAGDPDALGLTKQLKYLYITDKVKFMGHAASIPETLKNAAPCLIWFQSANKEPGGYAALEVSMSGLPQLFWDFQDMGTADPHEGVFPSFTEITSFVNYSKELLSSAALQEELGNKQKQYVLKNYAAGKHIHILEELFDERS